MRYSAGYCGRAGTISPLRDDTVTYNPYHPHCIIQHPFFFFLFYPVTPPRVPTSSRPAALNATPSRRAVPTRSAPTCTVSSAARPVRLRASPTPTPTSKRVSLGTTRLSTSTSRTLRSTFPVPRWPSVVSRRLRTATT
ncbi:cytochrome c [Coccidioides posadasii str. Silveira]|uniref:Cytochrome c n=1 Tax=Coccidioides posadasii (strain RMSCC 757 / Silveira) TaxID=443226 RepID=E9DF56_COCPS|nr:cytochrome c [Coccidioides posadasii str. Silveira]